MQTGAGREDCLEEGREQVPGGKFFTDMEKTSLWKSFQKIWAAHGHLVEAHG